MTPDMVRDEDMSEKPTLTKKDWAIGLGLGGGLGFLVGYFAKKPVLRLKEKYGIDPDHRLHHFGLGTSVATLGALSSSKSNFAPFITGFGTGMALEDFKDSMAPTMPNIFTMKTDTFRAEGEKSSPEVQWAKVPDIPSYFRYKGMCDIIRKIVYEDSNHPEVRKTAEGIIKTLGVDGRQTEPILMGMQSWIQQNIVFVNDPLKGPMGGATDKYNHAYITLPQSPTNPKGTGVGDCDCMFILFASMAQSVGIPGIVGILVDEKGRGYQHIMPGWAPDGEAKSIDDVIPIELTEDKPWGWRPVAKKYGLLLL